jgi:hypothetical protein
MTDILVAVADTSGITGSGSATIAGHFSSGAIFEQVTA